MGRPSSAAPKRWRRVAASGRKPASSNRPCTGTLTAPGMCPATGSTGSTSPRNRCRCSDVDEHPGPGRLGGLSCGHRGQVPARERQPGRFDIDWAAIEHPTGRGPCGDAAVEHAHVQPGPPQQPPGPGCGPAARLVVDDDRARLFDAEGTQSRSQGLQVWQRVAPVAWVASMPGEHGFQVEEPCAGQMSDGIPFAPSTVRFPQSPPHIEHGGLTDASP